MAAVQENSVWLVIDVPIADAKRVDDLKNELEQFAQDWIKKTMGNRWISGRQYNVTAGVATTSELCIFERKKG